MLVLTADDMSWWAQSPPEEEAWWMGHPPPSLAGAESLSKSLAFRFGLGKDTFAFSHVLDVGNGPTGLLSWFDRAAHSVGLDPLNRAYERMGARLEWYDRTPHGAIEEFMEGWVEKFDWVVSFNALDHGYSLPLALRNIAAYMKRDARALISVGCDQINMPDAKHPLKLHPAAVSGLMVAVGLQIEERLEGMMPIGTADGVQHTNTCSGGPVFHWFARKP